MSRKKNTIWDAAPHTIAKIAMLRKYLFVWFSVLGRTFSGKDLWYVDGFSGPGEYKNHPHGSPIAALQAAEDALEKTGRWVAGKVRLVFIEEDKSRFEHLRGLLESYKTHVQVEVLLYQGTFEAGVKWLKTLPGNPLTNGSPLFSFIDPFGPTGIPFTVISELLSRSSSEVLINFDSDGAVRVLKAGDDANHVHNLNVLFGGNDWEVELPKSMVIAQASRKAAALYLKRLMTLPNVDYGYSFEMRSKAGVIDYHLVFASQHSQGLVKMKEAMKAIDQGGEFSFCDSHVGQQPLFKSDDPTADAQRMAAQFAGRSVLYLDVCRFALNETPFTTPKSMLKVLENGGKISVLSANANRRKGTYRDGTITSVQF